MKKKIALLLCAVTVFMTSCGQRAVEASATDVANVEGSTEEMEEFTEPAPTPESTPEPPKETAPPREVDPLDCSNITYNEEENRYYFTEEFLNVISAYEYCEGATEEEIVDYLQSYAYVWDGAVVPYVRMKVEEVFGGDKEGHLHDDTVAEWLAAGINLSSSVTYNEEEERYDFTEEFLDVLRTHELFDGATEEAIDKFLQPESKMDWVGGGKGAQYVMASYELSSNMFDMHSTFEDWGKEYRLNSKGELVPIQKKNNNSGSTPNNNSGNTQPENAPSENVPAEGTPVGGPLGLKRGDWMWTNGKDYYLQYYDEENEVYVYVSQDGDIQTKEFGQKVELPEGFMIQ